MIIFTGLTGKSGSGLVDAMERHGFNEKFRVVIRENSNLEKIRSSKLDFETVVGDIEDEDFLRKAAEGCDTVFHIASKGLIGKVAKAMSQVESVKHCFMVSSTSIYSQYHLSSEKLIAAENEMKQAFREDITWTIIRPTMIYGKGDSNISIFMQWLNKYPIFPIVKNGKSLLQPVYKDDIGEAYYLLLSHKEEVKNQEFIVSGDKPITLQECLQTISASIGKKTKFVNIPLTVANWMVKIAYGLTIGRIDYREKFFRLTEDRAFDHRDITERFGYKPRSFADGVMELINDYKM